MQAELPTGGLVVVSALKGTTDGLLEACAAAGRGDLPAAQAVAERLRARHHAVAAELVWRAATARGDGA